MNETLTKSERRESRKRLTRERGRPDKKRQKRKHRQ